MGSSVSTPSSAAPRNVPQVTLVMDDAFINLVRLDSHGNIHHVNTNPVHPVVERPHIENITDNIKSPPFVAQPKIDMDHLKSQIRRELINEVKQEVRHQVTNEVREELYGEVMKSVSQKIANDKVNAAVTIQKQLAKEISGFKQTEKPVCAKEQELFKQCVAGKTITDCATEVNNMSACANRYDTITA